MSRRHHHNPTKRRELIIKIVIITALILLTMFLLRLNDLPSPFPVYERGPDGQPLSRP
jgi:hypothetical protein